MKNTPDGSQLLQALSKGALFLNAVRRSGVVAAAATSAAAALVSQPVFAEAAPEKSTINFKTLTYRDYQPSDDRIDIDAESFLFQVPIAGQWSVTGTAVHDAISGASPRYHSSSLAQIKDTRKAYTGAVTRYFQQGSVTVGTAYSKEKDYISRNYSIQNSWSTPSQNTTFIFGLGYTADKIIPNSIFLTQKEDKRVVDVALGVTQVLSQTDIAQVTYHHTRGRGYYSDQYKLYDARPDSRDSDSVLVRWNHHFVESANTLHSSYRYYTDSNDIDAHTLEFDYVFNLPNQWSITPLLRYYSQSAASFYYDPVANDPWADADTFGAPISVVYPLYAEGRFASMDQRLSSFGAITYGAKLTKHFGENWSADVKFERYEQKGSWALGNGSDGLKDFGARSIQFGISHSF
ncbi:MAG: DUF3570 domain-containing protein [Pseudomonadota bacterium]